MELEKTEIEGAVVLTPKVFGDNRGWFMESYSKRTLEELGISDEFIQDNRSFSAQVGTLRGLHCQTNPMAQAKLLTCLKGTITDIAVDIRKGSPTYKKWVAVELSEENKKMRQHRMSRAEREQTITRLTREMKEAARLLQFEHAAFLRDEIEKLQRGEDPTADTSTRRAAEKQRKTGKGRRSYKK